MAFYDWNHNGKKDMQDDYLEYQIYQQSMNDNNTSGPSSNSGCGTGCGIWGWIIIIIAIIELFS